MGYKLVWVTDEHFGVRNNDPFFLKKQLDWKKKQFLPYLKNNPVLRVVHGGDLFDNRKTTSSLILNEAFNYLSDIASLRIKQFVLIGNHDVYYKDDNSISPVHIVAKSIKDCLVVHDDCAIYRSDDSVKDKEKFLLVPWINPKNSEYLLSRMKSFSEKEETIVMGHFEIDGCEVNGGRFVGDLKQSFFHDFKQVVSGHFHCPSKSGNIWYTGNPFFFTWADCGQKKGFWSYDLDEKYWEFIENTDYVFFSYKSVDEALEHDKEECYVRVLVDGDEGCKERLEGLQKKLNSLNCRQEYLFPEEGKIEFNNSVTSSSDEDELEKDDVEGLLKNVVSSSGEIDEEKKNDLLQYVLHLHQKVKE
jgi:DNA repair exonuclease SbcCD nuclease subunit